MRGVRILPSPTPRFSRRAAVGLIAILMALLVASPKDAPMAERSVVKAPVANKKGAVADTGGAACLTKRTLMTMRGEIVDYYCYIEKAATGPQHRDCAVKCVSGDVCMGLLTTDGQLFMISVNHLRAMQPIQFRGIPDPFNAARGLIAEKVDLTGYAMERKGQKIIEIMDVKKAVPGSPVPKAPRG